jgi:predicted Rossmann fold nucleotide-binding protein DprA/Smf involved in DNA uptake
MNPRDSQANIKCCSISEGASALVSNQIDVCTGSFQVVSTIDSKQILSKPMLALFWSERCPGDLIIKACDAATALRDASVPVISGFHSPVERECLRILLRGTQPVVISPARSLERMRAPADWRDPIREGRLLLVSPFAAKHNRITAALAAQRNEFVAALAHAVLVVYADPAGLIESLARKIFAWRKPLFALESNDASSLRPWGAELVDTNSVMESWRKQVTETVRPKQENECST